MNGQENCAACRFFLRGKTKATAFADVGGMCRRYAPAGPAAVAPGSDWQVFPPMSEHQWCGDFRPKTVPDLAAGRLVA